jgi:tRNA (pseudouridine54-N1)-methyltransferase
VEGVDRERAFLLVANSAVASGDVDLADLPGSGGRFDIVARFVARSLLTSHGIREDTQAVVHFTRPDDESVALRVHGEDVSGLRPDERSTAARLAKALSSEPMPVWQTVDEGVETRVVSFEELLADPPEPLTLLTEAGDPIEDLDLDGGTFVIGDHEGLTSEQRSLAAERAAYVASVGPVSLQADQVATIVNNELDRHAPTHVDR